MLASGGYVMIECTHEPFSPFIYCHLRRIACICLCGRTPSPSFRSHGGSSGGTFYDGHGVGPRSGSAGRTSGDGEPG